MLSKLSTNMENCDTAEKTARNEKTCMLEEFKEIDEVTSIIASLKTIYNNQTAVEIALERFQYIVDLYQEQPHLLDPHLERLCGQLLTIVKSQDVPVEVIHLSFQLLYFITKTRGYKVIVRLMPHEVADLEPILALLSKQSSAELQTWSTRYMLLLWLSIVIMIPFDMCRLDGDIDNCGDGNKARVPIMLRIIDVGKAYLNVTDKSRDSASYMLSKFLTRPDVKRLHLAPFIDWALVKMTAADRDTLPGQLCLCGLLSVLAATYKHGKREDLVNFAPVILQKVSELELLKNKNALLRKLTVKLVQRLGLSFLKARLATWRYQRGTRSLADNLTLMKQQDGSEVKQLQTVDNDDEDYDIPDSIEEIIEKLLSSLKDKNTVVRWSAAKGLGRITGRLHKELADEIVGSVMELFSITENENAWHGGCLTMAELGRRGLILPSRLCDVVPVIVKALVYDEKCGNFSFGANVRDSACYLSWSFARAYSAQELAPYIQTMASMLVTVSIFDREVNVRRAAAAAFQENVGRQGQFPHGIDILSTCDYFAVGSRKNCYLELSVFVAQFSEYTVPLIEHLLQFKIGHWDITVRWLTAKCLQRLTAKAPEYMINSVLPLLVKECLRPDVNLHHGALLAIAHVLHAVYLEQINTAPESNLCCVRKIPPDGVMNESSNFTRTVHKIKLLTDRIFFYMQPSCEQSINVLEVQLQESLLVLITRDWSESFKLYHNLVHMLSNENVKSVASRSHLSQSKLQEANFFKGVGGDMMKKAACCLIEKCSASKLPCHGSSVIGVWQAFLDECLLHIDPEIQGAAVKAIPLFFAEYYTTADGAVIIEARDRILAKYLKELDSGVETTRCGHALAIGALPLAFLVDNLDAILSKLIAAAKITPKYVAFVDCRRDSLQALTSICKRVQVNENGSSNNSLDQTNVSLVYDTFFAAMKDYTLDSRGDVGAGVREAAMTGMYELASVVLQASPQMINEHLGRKMLCELMQQACEKIDRTRGHAGELFAKLLYHRPPIPIIRYKTDLIAAFPEEKIANINWASPADTFPKFASLIALPMYSYSILLGMCVGAGGLTESLVKLGVSSLRQFFRSCNAKQVKATADVLLAIFNDYQKVDRVTMPLMKSLDQLLSGNCFALLSENDRNTFANSLLAHIKAEIARCKDVHKTLASIDLFCDLLQFDTDVKKGALTQLLILLCHSYPIVRKSAASKLYEATIMFEDVIPVDTTESVTALLVDTLWDQSLDVVRPVRNELCDILEIKRPVPVQNIAK